MNYQENVRFGRFDSTTKMERFSYERKTGKEAILTDSDLSLERAGEFMGVFIKNYMRENLLVVNSLNTEHKVIPSIYRGDKIMLDDTTNSVMVEIVQIKKTLDKEHRVITSDVEKSYIRFMGYHLEKGPVFVEEIGAYLTLTSRLEATKALIRQDARTNGPANISLPNEMIKPRPQITFGDFYPLFNDCIRRADGIIVRVGRRVDKQDALVQSLRIGIFDRIHSPYYAQQMYYDPALGPDDLIIEHANAVVDRPIKLTFSQLHDSDNRTIYIESNVEKTMRGELCSLVIFGDTDAATDYLFRHQTNEIYDELSDRIIVKSGGYGQKMKITDLETTIEDRDQMITVLEEKNETKREKIKEQDRLIKSLESTINRIRTNHDSTFDYDHLMIERNNEREKLSLERAKLHQDRIELEQKRTTARAANRAAVLKAVADFAKSFWGIAVMATGIAAAGYKWWTKLRSTT